MKAILRIMKIVVERLNLVVPLEEYTKIYPHSEKKYLIWEILSENGSDVFGVIIKDKKVTFVEDVIINSSAVKNEFMAGRENDKIEGLVEVTPDAIMDLVLGKSDLFACEFVYKNINLYSARPNLLRSLLYLMFSEQSTKVRKELKI